MTIPELQELIKMPDGSTDDPNKNHCSLKGSDKEKMLSPTLNMTT